MAGIRLGDILPQEFNKYLGITLSEEHLKLFKETHRRALKVFMVKENGICFIYR